MGRHTFTTGLTEEPRDRRRRVLFVNGKRRPPLGADTWVHLAIMRELERGRTDVHVACVFGSRREPTPTYQQVREIPDVTILNVDLGRELAGGSIGSKAVAVLSLIPAAWDVLRLAAYIRRHDIDVIYTADRPRDAAVSVLLGRLTRASSVVHIHVGYDPAWMQPMLRWAIRRADALIAISQFVADTLQAADRDPTTIHVVMNGIELERWNPDEDGSPIRAELGIASDAPVVVTVCRLFRAKGVSELVEAFARTTARIPTGILLVVGDEMEAGYLAELQTLVRDLGIHDRVVFLGHRHDVDRIMATADIFAMPSLHEPFGLVYAEAMAMQLPVVALDNGGTVEIVEHGVTGLLSPHGDIDTLADNLARLMTDPELRRTFGVRGRAAVERRFTTSRMATGVADVYDTVAHSLAR